MKELKTTCGTTFLVDDEEADEISKFAWKLDRDGYVIRKTTISGKKGRTVRLHRVIAKAISGQAVDHADHNKLNNTKCNLRIATKSENACNQTKHGGSSSFKGVTWNKNSGKWQAQIAWGSGKRRYLGLFSDEHSAAHAYNKAAIQLHGEYARLNPVGVAP